MIFDHISDISLWETIVVHKICFDQGFRNSTLEFGVKKFSTPESPAYEDGLQMHTHNKICTHTFSDSIYHSTQFITYDNYSIVIWENKSYTRHSNRAAENA